MLQLPKQYLSREQHQMLEDLTGLQYTKTGKVRQKQNRSDSESKRLGLETEWLRLWRKVNVEASEKRSFQGTKK